ncbi:Wall-associated receptor kinase-like [Quillaja saponaria]|uniref:Wall-associated receptor kinase-like n=1 Tax=Quillaja saponaria TaxID=32244 RepID=A0AAD7PUH9_QUISA|nr:Wall-associated receptor kinase-like [Quillaja saponaria]
MMAVEAHIADTFLPAQIRENLSSEALQGDTQSVIVYWRNVGANYTSVYWRNVGAPQPCMIKCLNMDQGLILVFLSLVVFNFRDSMNGGGTCGFDTETLLNFLCLCKEGNVTTYCPDHDSKHSRKVHAIAGTITAVSAAGAFGIGVGIWYLRKVRAKAPVHVEFKAMRICFSETVRQIK